MYIQIKNGVAKLARKVAHDWHVSYLSVQGEAEGQIQGTIPNQSEVVVAGGELVINTSGGATAVPFNAEPMPDLGDPTVIVTISAGLRVGSAPVKLTIEDGKLRAQRTAIGGNLDVEVDAAYYGEKISFEVQGLGLDAIVRGKETTLGIEDRYLCRVVGEKVPEWVPLRKLR